MANAISMSLRCAFALRSVWTYFKASGTPFRIRDSMPSALVQVALVVSSAVTFVSDKIRAGDAVFGLSSDALPLPKTPLISAAVHVGVGATMGALVSRRERFPCGLWDALGGT